MRKTRILLAAVVGTVAVSLTACGGTQTGSGAEGTVTLQMVESLTNPARTMLLKKILADFEQENPNVKVQLVSPPTEQADGKIQQMLQAKSGIDVLEVRDTTVGSFSNNGWLYDLAPDLKGWDGMDALTQQAKEATYDEQGHAWYIPYGFMGASLFYRTDLVEEAGFDGPPHSWVDMVDQAAKIQDPSHNRYGFALRGGQHANAQVTAILEAYNAENIDPKNAFKTKDGRSIFASAKSEEGFNVWYDLFKKGSPESSVSWGYPEMVEGFTNGSTASLIQDPEVIAAVKESSLKQDQWSLAKNLVGPDGKATWPLSATGWGVASSSKRRAQAIKLVKYLSGSKSTEFAHGNSLVPIRKDATEDEYFKTGLWKIYVEMAASPEVYVPVNEPRRVKWWAEWDKMADTDIQNILLGTKKIEQVLAEWDKYWTEKWAG